MNLILKICNLTSKVDLYFLILYFLYNKNKLENMKSETMKSKSKKVKKNETKLRKVSKRSRTPRKSRIMRGGYALDIKFWDSLNDNERTQLINEANPNNNTNLKKTIEDVQDVYRTRYGTKQLYDFIFSNEQFNTLIKIWDHKVNDPSSITAGLPGIHLYTIYDNGKYQVIGKFIRN